METIIGGGAMGAGGGPNGAVIKDSDTENFLADVIEASSVTPVIVDFWAPWCEPCKQLGPTIEKVVKAAGGAVRLVKVNIDENQPLAQQMRIQSIPAVYAFVDGQPVDGFTGALPESQIQAFVDKLTAGAGEAGPSPVEAAMEQAKGALDADDGATAAAIYGQVLQHEPGNLAAAAGLARCAVAAGDFEQARAVLDSLPATAAEDGDVSAARSALDLAEKASAAAGQIPEFQARLAADENDHQARFDLAVAHFGMNQPETAINELIEIVRRARTWNEEAARKQLVQIFEALGHTHELTIEGRRRLSSVLFS
jgi:putative thioredoxin